MRLQLDQVVDAEVWKTRIDRRLVRISTITRLELGYSVRTGLRDGWSVPKAVDPDLLIAATAEKVGLTVLAVDKDFELIAGVTGPSVETLVLR